ncbi:MAG: lysophospholipid acyltransferase family protein [Pseudolabrys sp.]
MTTSRVVIEPANINDEIAANLPVIIAMWHGQHALVAYIRPPEHRFKVLISRHRDGGINAAALHRLGVATVRGSGDHGGEFRRKGGFSAFREMLTALEEGYHMALTADVPKVPRVAGLGIVKLAQLSGRPIYPVAVATSRRIQLENWDRSVINLPFSRLAGVIGDPIRVAVDASDDTCEGARRALEDALNAATARAYALADGNEGAAGG